MPKVEIDFVGNDEMGGVADKAVGSITDLASAISLVELVLGYAKKAFDETVGVTVSYASEVRSLQQVTGASAEETSKLIQVLDDYKISTQSAMLAQKSLTKEGIVLTTDSLAKLSEQYLAIGSQADKNAFAQKNLGRSYKDFIEILQQGPAAIKAANDAIEPNLILTQKAADDARIYEQQVNRLSDAFMAFKIKAGTEALPYVSTALNNFTKSMNENGLAGAVFLFSLDDIINIFRSAPPVLEGTTAALNSLGNSEEEIAAKTAEAAKQMQVMTAANTGLLGLTRTIQSETDSYEKSLGNLNAKHVELQQNLDTLTAQKWPENSQKVIDAKNALNDNRQAVTDLAAGHGEAMRKIAYDLFVTKLQANGFTDAEFAIAIQAGVTAGVIDRATADMTIKMNNTANAAVITADSFDTAAEHARAMAGEYVVRITTIYGDVGQANYAQGGPSGGGVVHAHADGGSFLIPQSYGNEGFRMGNGDTASAGERVTIAPKGGASASIDDASIDKLIRGITSALQRSYA